jgi:uncharacterized damage-inducible protein DinB
MSEKPFMYRDMTECELLRWALDYRMDPVIDTFRSIPEEHAWVRPRPNVNSSAFIFGHIAVTERSHIGRFLQGVEDIPATFRPFRASRPKDEDIRAAVASKEALIDYWREVRAKTHGYLDRLTDADLKKVPETSALPVDDPNRGNPIREWFIMTIEHQNQHWGQLEIIAKMVEDR